MSESGKERLLLLKRLFLLTKAVFLGAGMGKGRLFLAALFVLSLAIGGVQVLMSFAARDFITSLTQRDHAGWMRALWKYLGTFALSIPIAVLYRYCGDRLSLAWRKWMTHHLVKRYFFNRA